MAELDSFLSQTFPEEIDFPVLHSWKGYSGMYRMARSRPSLYSTNRQYLDFWLQLATLTLQVHDFFFRAEKTEDRLRKKSLLLHRTIYPNAS